MKNNKGITLTSLVVYIAAIFVVIATLMRITTYFGDNMADVADVSFETEFQKINLYLLDETKKSKNSILEITEDEKQITFSKGNKYTYNAQEKRIYLNETIKVCEGVETCLFEEKTADNGKSFLELKIKINETEKTANYVITSSDTNTTLLPSEYQQVEYIESTGTQYIDTMVKANSLDSIEMTCMSTGRGSTSTQQMIFGGRVDTNSLQQVMGCFGIGGQWTYFSWGEMKKISNITPELNVKYSINILNNELYINDTKYMTYANSFLGDTNIYLFNLNGDTQNRPFYGRIYSFIIKGKINLIPCYSITTVIDVNGNECPKDTVGLYDTVEGKFYTNQGTGEFIKGSDILIGKEDYIEEEDYIFNMREETEEEEEILLGAQYQQVEYIQSTGTQYINTDILDIATEILEYNIDIQINEGNTRGCFGANDGSYISFVDNHVYAIWGNSFFENDNERHTITIKNHKEESATYFYQDSTFKSKVVSGKILLGNNFSLFAVGMDSSGSVAYNSKCKLYSLKAIRDGILIGDFIPCYRKSDNIAGLYDLVNNKFYTNAGTGEFIVGPNVD